APAANVPPDDTFHTRSNSLTDISLPPATWLQQPVSRVGGAEPPPRTRAQGARRAVAGWPPHTLGVAPHGMARWLSPFGLSILRWRRSYSCFPGRPGTRQKSRAPQTHRKSGSRPAAPPTKESDNPSRQR